MAEAEHVLDLEVFFSSQRPLLNPVEKMIPGLVSMLGAVAGAVLGRSNPGLLWFVVGFGAGTGKSTSSALPEQVPSAGIASRDNSSDSREGNLGRRHRAEGILPPHLHLALEQLRGKREQPPKLPSQHFSQAFCRKKCAGRCWQPRS